MTALKLHWPEYLIEGACLGLFMLSAFCFGTLIEHPASPVRRAIENPMFRRFLMGLAMGGTAIAIVYSPWGKRSGAHINPATTLAFFRLGRVARWDAVFFIAAHFIGGALGAFMAAILLLPWVAHPAVNFVVTVPGDWGKLVAFSAEVAITFVLMSVVLHVSNNRRLHKLTGLCAGALVAFYITVEAPLSGMSMNPARSFASAVAAMHWADLWIYFAAPVIGMLSAAELYRRLAGPHAVACAKLHHDNPKRCIFCGKSATRADSWNAPHRSREKISRVRSK